MKSFILAAFLGLTSLNSFATITKLVIKDPCVGLDCDNAKYDTLYSMGLVTETVKILETTTTFKFTVTNSLKFCNVQDGKLKWKRVNPFTGFEVPYFDSIENRMKIRTEVIKSNVPSNRFDTVIVTEDYKSARVERMAPLSDSGGAFSGNLTFNRNEILNQDDVDALNSGKEIKKVVVLSFISNMTMLIDGKVSELDVGDRLWSGRNLILTFKKINNVITLSSLE